VNLGPKADGKCEQREAQSRDLPGAEDPVDAGFSWFKGTQAASNGQPCPVDLLTCGSTPIVYTKLSARKLATGSQDDDPRRGKLHSYKSLNLFMADRTQVDIIVCGGGSCGCVVAGRLANLDHNLQVLLIEGGENNLNNPWVYRPGIYPRNMKLDSKTASFYYSRPSEWLDGRRAVVPCAHILGGGSSINFMVWLRQPRTRNPI
jgi:hypothetical protein